MSTKPIIKELLIEASPSAVWKALTNKEDLKQWYFDFQNFDASPGCEFEFTAGSGDKKLRHLFKVLEVVPERRFSYSWQYENLPGTSKVTFDLAPEGIRTKLRLTHEGVENFASNGPDFARESFAAGWEQLAGIKIYLEKPTLTITKSVLIEAPVSQVWEVITDPTLVNEWIKGFCETMSANSTWQKGSGVELKFGYEGESVEGIVEESIPNKLLKVDFYQSRPHDTLSKNVKATEKLGPYSETFELKEQEGKTLFQVTAGLLNEVAFHMSGPMWERALLLIQGLSEKQD